MLTAENVSMTTTFTVAERVSVPSVTARLTSKVPSPDGVKTNSSSVDKTVSSSSTVHSISISVSSGSADLFQFALKVIGVTSRSSCCTAPSIMS